MEVLACAEEGGGGDCVGDFVKSPWFEAVKHWITAMVIGLAVVATWHLFFDWEWFGVRDLTNLVCAVSGSMIASLQASIRERNELRRRLFP